jgi:iron complex outermembrane recepter protein
LKQNHKTFLSRVLAIVCFAAIYLISSTCNLYAQQQDSSASISGTVVDSKGALVRDAAVIVKNQTTGAVSQANADNVGHFAVTGIPSGRYTLIVNAKGFASTTQEDVQASAHPAEISITLAIGNFAQSVEVQSNNSIASQHALSQGSLDAETVQSNISAEFIRNFTPATTDFSELINIAPGTISYNPNGVGLGQGTMYFRGFVDGDYNITWDGIPFNDSNNPTHHSWSFFPGPWIGGVNFDRSPGTASTIGQATFGGS